MSSEISFDWNNTQLKKYLKLDNWDFVFASNLIAGFDPIFENHHFSKILLNNYHEIMQDWGIEYGSEKLIIFPQVHEACDGSFNKKQIAYLLDHFIDSTEKLKLMELMYKTSKYRLTGLFVGEEDSKERPDVFAGIGDNRYLPTELVRSPNWWISFFYEYDIKPDWYEWAEEQELIKLIHLDQESAFEYDEDRYPEDLAIANIIYQALMKSNSKVRPTDQIREYLEQYYPKIKKTSLQYKRLVTLINWEPGNKK